MVNGDLMGYMGFPWPEGDIKVVAQQLFEALKLMHDHQRLHLDLKPEVNIQVIPFCSGLSSTNTPLIDPFSRLGGQG